MERMMPLKDTSSNNLLCPACKRNIGFKTSYGWKYYPTIGKYDYACKCGQLLVAGRKK